MTPLRKGMTRMNPGITRWLSGLERFLKWARRESCGPPAAASAERPGPRSEGERALWQAMGWSEDAWDDGEG